MNIIGTSVASGVIGSVKGSWEPEQTNERKEEDEKTYYVLSKDGEVEQRFPK
jgi:hypothetical protein